MQFKNSRSHPFPITSSNAKCKLYLFNYVRPYSYQFDKEPGSETKNFIVPLSYDRKHRTITTLPVIESGLNSTNWLKILFMPGVDLGHVQTMGSIIVKPPSPILGNPNLKPTIFIKKIGAGHSSARSSVEDDDKK